MTLLFMSRMLPDVAGRVAEVIVEAMVEISRAAEAGSVGDLGGGAGVLPEELHRPLQADLPDGLAQRFSGELLEFSVDAGPAHAELTRNLLHPEALIAQVGFDQPLEPVEKYPVHRGHLQHLLCYKQDKM